MINFIIIFLLAGMSAVLSNQRIAIFNDQLRLELNSENSLSKEFIDKSLKTLLLFVLTIAFPFTLLFNVLSLFLVFGIGDILGLAFKKNLLGTILAFLSSGVISLLIILNLPLFQEKLINLSNINISNINEIFNVFKLAYVIIPILIINYQFGLKKGVSSFVILFIFYLLSSKFLPNFSPMILTTFVGFILYYLIFFLNFKPSKDTSLSFTTRFADNIKLIQKRWYLFTLLAGLISLSIYYGMVTPNFITMAFHYDLLLNEIVLILVIYSISILPPLMASTLVSGCYSPYGMGLSSIFSFIALVIMRYTNFNFPYMEIVYPVIFFIIGALAGIFEIWLIKPLTNLFERHSEYKSMAEASKYSLTILFDLSMISGSLFIIEKIFSSKLQGAGVIYMMGLYLIIRNKKKRFIEPYGVGPFAIISLALLLFLLSYLHLY